MFVPAVANNEYMGKESVFVPAVANNEYMGKGSILFRQ